MGLFSANKAGIGYLTGDTVKQESTITTAVTINELSGQVETVSESWDAGATKFFSVNNTCVDASDVICVAVQAGDDKSFANVVKIQDKSFHIAVTNFSENEMSGVVVKVNFVVIKGNF